MSALALVVMIAASVLSVLALVAPSPARRSRHRRPKGREADGRVRRPGWDWDWAADQEAARRHGPYATVVLGVPDTVPSHGARGDGPGTGSGERRPHGSNQRQPAGPGHTERPAAPVVPPPASLARRFRDQSSPAPAAPAGESPGSPPAAAPSPRPSPRPAGPSRPRRGGNSLTWSRAGEIAGESDHQPVVRPRRRAAVSSDASGHRRPAQAPRAEAQPNGSRPRSPRLRLYAAAAALTLAALAFVAGSPVGLVVPAGGAATLLTVRCARHRTSRRHRQALTEAAPVAIDLLSACLLAGLNPHLALQRVAERCPQALRDELGQVASELDLGRSPAAALRAAAERTRLDELRAAAAALEAAAQWGMPPSEALAARAEALRTRARLAAEAAAGRAAVRLAFPLVVCFLPAFFLLTVVPVMAGAIHTLAP